MRKTSSVIVDGAKLVHTAAFSPSGRGSALPAVLALGRNAGVFASHADASITAPFYVGDFAVRTAAALRAELSPRAERRIRAVRGTVRSPPARRASSAADFSAVPHASAALAAQQLATSAGVPAVASAAAAAAPLASSRTLISQLLGHFKQTAEVRQYLKYYGSVSSQRFAIIRLSGDVLTSEEETARVAASLAFLHRIGLVPIVVHGAGLFTGRRAGAVADAAAGGDVAGAAREHMLQANAALVAALKREGVEAAPLAGNVFDAAPDAAAAASAIDGGATAAVAGVAGRVTGVKADLLTSAVEAGRIPIVASLCLSESAPESGSSSSGSSGFLTFPTSAACAALARALKPLKVIWLRPEGGLRSAPATSSSAASAASASAAPAVVRSVDLSELDASQPSAAAALTSSLIAEDAALLPELAQMYEAAASSASSSAASSPDAPAGMGGVSVSVTKPEHLAEELFTARGSGTVLLRRERISHHDSLDGIDVPRVRALVEEAFGAALPADYFDAMTTHITVAGSAPGTTAGSSCGVAAESASASAAAPTPAAEMAEMAPGTRRLRRIYVSDSYRGVAIVTEEAGLPGVAYLDKFAVSKSAQGDKLGEALWRVMLETERGQLYWRSRQSNRVNDWYAAQSSGHFKAPAGDWSVFWCGLAMEAVMPAITTALALKPTFPMRVYPTGTAEMKGPTEQPALK